MLMPRARQACSFTLDDQHCDRHMQHAADRQGQRLLRLRWPGADTTSSTKPGSPDGLLEVVHGLGDLEGPVHLQRQGWLSFSLQVAIASLLQEAGQPVLRAPDCIHHNHGDVIPALGLGLERQLDLHTGVKVNSCRPDMPVSVPFC